MPTLAPDLLAWAAHKVAEYNASFEQGGELRYPHEAFEVLRAHEAEELTRRIEALGRNV